MMGAMNGGRVAPGGCYVAALCPPATVSIQQVKIPVGCGWVYTQCEVPESDSNGVHGAPEAAPICQRRSREERRKNIQLRKPSGKVCKCYIYVRSVWTHGCAHAIYKHCVRHFLNFFYRNFNLKIEKKNIFFYYVT